MYVSCECHMCEEHVCGCPETSVEAIGSPRVRAIRCGCELLDVGAAK